MDKDWNVCKKIFIISFSLIYDNGFIFFKCFFGFWRCLEVVYSGWFKVWNDSFCEFSGWCFKEEEVLIFFIGVVDVEFMNYFIVR